mgnify:CR=1 FL=1
MPYKSKEKRNENSRKYREANKEKVAEKQRKYQEDNREKLAEAKKQYREANREKIAETNRKYHEANREKIKQYRENNKKKIAETNRQYQQTPMRKRSNRIFGWKRQGIKLPEEYGENWDIFYEEEYLSTTNCEVCGVELTEDKRSTSTTKCLDHNHITGLFRNVLCHACNTKRG